MKKAAIALLLFLTSLIYSPASQSQVAALKVFILAGQSNMMGIGNETELPAELIEPVDSVLYYQYSISGSRWITQTPELNFGPELTFARCMTGTMGEPIGIIKLAFPATNLAFVWNPDLRSSLYKTLMNLVHDAQKTRPITITGMLWMQGENDSSFKNMAYAYKSNLQNLICRVRSDVGVSGLPFVAGRVNPNAPYVGIVRDAQMTAGDDDGDGIAECHEGSYAWVDCDGIPNSKYFDNVHYNTAGQIELGYRFAEAMLGLLGYGGATCDAYR
jgi:hypothetical protein